MFPLWACGKVGESPWGNRYMLECQLLQGNSWRLGWAVSKAETRHDPEHYKRKLAEAIDDLTTAISTEPP